MPETNTPMNTGSPPHPDDLADGMTVRLRRSSGTAADEQLLWFSVAPEAGWSPVSRPLLKGVLAGLEDCRERLLAEGCGPAPVRGCRVCVAYARLRERSREIGNRSRSARCDDMIAEHPHRAAGAA